MPETDSLLNKDSKNKPGARSNKNSRWSNDDYLRPKICGVSSPKMIGLMIVIMSVAVAIFAFSLWSRNSSPDDTGNAASDDDIENGLAEMDSNGKFLVHYQHNFTSTTTTYADLAKIMLLPWYEASLLALTVLQPNVDPSSVQGARQVLLTTRDLLDVFSPVYPTRSMWITVRSYYKQGYEVVGDFQDLDHAGIEYSPELWEKRRQLVLHWKSDFERYHSKHDIGSFLKRAVTDHCYDHKESHLFWSDVLDKLPCGSDLATPSLGRLAVVQLNNSLDYLATILNYQTVLEVYQQEDYHNLRKELRSFLDEYDLFGFVMLPNETKEDHDNLKVLQKARHLLGVINDDWTAYNIYVTRNEHEDEQVDLAKKIDQKWVDFKEWTKSNDLASVIASLSDSMNVKK